MKKQTIIGLIIGIFLGLSIVAVAEVFDVKLILSKETKAILDNNAIATHQTSDEYISNIIEQKVSQDTRENITREFNNIITDARSSTTKMQKIIDCVQQQQIKGE